MVRDKNQERRELLSRKHWVRLLLVCGIPGLLWPWLLLVLGGYPERPNVQLVEDDGRFSLGSALSQLGVVEQWGGDEEHDTWTVGVNMVHNSNMLYDVIDKDEDSTPDLLVVNSEGLASGPTKQYLRFQYGRPLRDGGYTKWPAVFTLGDQQVPGTVWQYIDIDSDGLVDARTPSDTRWADLASGDILLDYEWVPVQRELGVDGVPIYQDREKAREFRWEGGRWLVVSQN